VTHLIPGASLTGENVEQIRALESTVIKLQNENKRLRGELIRAHLKEQTKPYPKDGAR
jgi:hypothetical protein